MGAQRSKGARLEIRLTEEKRAAIKALAENLERTETWVVERGVDLILARPDLTPAAVEALEAEVARLRRELERVTTRVSAEWTERVRARQEERRAASGRWPWQR